MSRAIQAVCALAALLAVAASEPLPKAEAEAEPIQVDDLGVSAKPWAKVINMLGWLWLGCEILAQYLADD